MTLSIEPSSASATAWRASARETKPSITAWSARDWASRSAWRVRPERPKSAREWSDRRGPTSCVTCESAAVSCHYVLSPSPPQLTRGQEPRRRPSTRRAGFVAARTMLLVRDRAGPALPSPPAHNGAPLSRPLGTPSLYQRSWIAARRDSEFASEVAFLEIAFHNPGITRESRLRESLRLSSNWFSSIELQHCVKFSKRSLISSARSVSQGGLSVTLRGAPRRDART